AMARCLSLAGINVSVSSVGGNAVNGNGGAGGAITLNGGSILTKSLLFSRGGQGLGAGNGGHGGAVSITSTGSIVLDTLAVALDSILSRGGDSSLGNGGNAGSITVVGASVT